MPARTIDPLPKVQDDAPPLEGLELEPEGFDGEFAFKRVSFRGTTYKLIELPIGEYDKIERAVTVTKELPDGTEAETFNEPMRNRMMLQKSIVEPKGVVVANLGTRLYLNLQRVMQELHYAPEADALRDKKKTPATEEAAKGN